MSEANAVLREDGRLPHIDMALSRKRALAFFNERVLPAVLPGREAVDLSRRRVRYKPGKECRVHYRLKIAGGDEPLYQVVTLTFRRGHQLEEAARAGPGGNGSLPGRSLLLEDESCLVEFFPADYRLPGLRHAVDPEAIARQLRQAGGRFAGSRVIRVKTLRYRPGFTCVLRYTLEDEHGQHHVVGKVYPAGEAAGATQRKLKELSEQAAAHGLVIPAPLDLPQEGDLVLMTRVAGANLDRALLATSSQEEAAPLIETAARALAGFHALRLDAPLARSVEHDFRRLGQRLHRVRLVAPDLAKRAQALLDGLDRAQLATPANERAPVHGDFKPNQLLVDHGRPALVDLDRAGLGDPAVDLGNFMAVLHKKAVVNGQEHFRPLAEAFLRSYLEARAGSTALERRARRYQGVSLVRMVLAKFERAPRSYARRGARWPWLGVLDEAEQCLGRP